MAALTPDEIADATGCWSCFPDKWAAALYLLNQIRLDSGGDAMTNDEIAAEAACFTCFPDKESVGLYLLNSIVTNSLAGGVSCGATDPVDAPSSTCALYYNTVTQVIWQWNGSAWQ